MFKFIRHMKYQVDTDVHVRTKLCLTIIGLAIIALPSWYFSQAMSIAITGIAVLLCLFLRKSKNRWW